MQLNEMLFFGIFLLFIVGILLLDMLVIDKKAHEVSMKEAGIWTAVWITLALAFSIFLWFHGDLVHGISDFQELQAVTTKYAGHLKLDPGDFEGGLAQYRHHMTITYITGYLIEKMLSVDNLFVMMMIFSSFGVSKLEYQHVLNWGILGAIVLRFIFIFLGAAIINRFDWVLLVFGAFLIYSGLKMMFEKKQYEAVEPSQHPVVKFLSKHFRVYPRFAGDRFFVFAKRRGDDYELADKKSGGLRFITPLFVTVVFIEFSDLIFAFDSIPAIFSVTLDPYVVFFSNIFAILGLRAMFFLLAGMADKFRFLKHGVSVLLLFIGVKLLINKLVHIDALLSLGIILLVLVISIGLSLYLPAKEQKA